ncbi:MAG: hypothetical protein ACRDAT_00925 [Cetobacterium sp.]
MKKIIIVGLFLLSGISFSSNVVFVANEKKYHLNRDCRTLKKAKVVKEIEIKKVGSRTECKVCS